MRACQWCWRVVLTHGWGVSGLFAAPPKNRAPSSLQHAVLGLYNGFVLLFLLTMQIYEIDLGVEITHHDGHDNTSCVLCAVGIFIF